MDKLKQWVALTVVGCLGILAGGWFLLVSPKKAEAADLQAQASAQLSTNDSLRTQLDVLKAQAKDLPKKQADLARVAAKIPDNPALPALIRSLTAAATSAGVQLVSVTPGPPAPVAVPVAAAPATTPAEGTPPAEGAPVEPAEEPAAAPVAGAPAAAGPAGVLASIPVSINVVGGYFEVAQFMSNLESLPRALRVTNLTLAPGASPTASATATGTVQDGRTLSNTITGSVYMAADRPVATPVVVPAS